MDKFNNKTLLFNNKQYYLCLKTTTTFQKYLNKNRQIGYYISSIFSQVKSLRKKLKKDFH